MRRLVAIVLMILLGAVPAVVQAQVRDQAGFFTPNAVERANQLISQLRQQTRHGVVVETISSVPADRQAQMQSMGRDRFFSEMAAERARESGASGVYVLISKEPSYLKVAVGDETQRSGLFTVAQRDQLRDTLLSNFRSRNYDQGLLEAVGMVQRTMVGNAQLVRGGAAAAAGAATGDRTLRTFPGQAQAPAQQTRTGTPAATPAPAPRPQEQRSSGPGFLFWLVVIGGGFLVLMFVMRRLAARAQQRQYGQVPDYGNQNAPPPPLPGQYPGQYGQPNPGYGAGGGGFGRGIFGGLLGGMAGGWLWDRMSRHDTPAGGGAFPGQGTTPAETNPDPFSAAPPDRDFSVSSGGEFGDTGGGGGDWGGGGDFDDDSGGGSF